MSCDHSLLARLSRLPLVRYQLTAVRYRLDAAERCGGERRRGGHRDLRRHTAGETK